MIGSPLPLAERRDWQPHGSAVPLPAAPTTESFPPPRLVPAPPLKITYPGSLAARLVALAERDRDDRIRDRRDETGRIAGEVSTEQTNRQASRIIAGRQAADIVVAQTLPLTASLDRERDEVAPQAVVRALVRDFHRRQRQASFLVAGCLGTACVLTVGGIAILASLVTPAPRETPASTPAPAPATSIAWQVPGVDSALPAPRNPETANRARKTGPLLIQAKAEMDIVGGGLLQQAAWRAPRETPPTAVIFASGDRPLALAPLLSQRQARYLMLRGLPAEAELSSGTRNKSGAWVVKTRDLADLSLSVQTAAAGDYPIEIYSLNSGNAPQGRQIFLLRVGSPSGASAAAGLNISWPAVLLDMAMMTLAAEGHSVHDGLSPLFARAERLLTEGDIAGARLILHHLAENGEADAAYELARTFDPAVLEELGVRGIEGDRKNAVGWYQRASRTGNAKANERLNILASLSDPRPGD